MIALEKLCGFGLLKGLSNLLGTQSLSQWPGCLFVYVVLLRDTPVSSCLDLPELQSTAVRTGIQTSAPTSPPPPALVWPLYSPGGSVTPLPVGVLHCRFQAENVTGNPSVDSFLTCVYAWGSPRCTVCCRSWFSV